MTPPCPAGSPRNVTRHTGCPFSVAFSALMLFGWNCTCERAISTARSRLISLGELPGGTFWADLCGQPIKGVSKSNMKSVTGTFIA